MKRAETLILKELDGELSRSEAVELERAEWTNPDIRRSRDGWQRTTQALGELGPQAVRIPVDSWASRIADEAKPDASWAARLRRWFDDTDIRPWTFGAWSLATALALAVVWLVVPPAAVEKQKTALRTVDKTPVVAPVEILVEHPGADDFDDSPVSIRF